MMFNLRQSNHGLLERLAQRFSYRSAQHVAGAAHWERHGQLEGLAGVVNLHSGSVIAI